MNTNTYLSRDEKEISSCSSLARFYFDLFLRERPYATSRVNISISAKYGANKVSGLQPHPCRKFSAGNG